MSRTLPDQLVGAHPQMLRVDIEHNPQKLAELRLEIGQSIARAFEAMGITQQEAAHLMHYRDQGTVSRWCRGTERPLFDKLFALEGFEEAWLLVRAKRHPRMDVVTEIRIRGVA